MNKIITYMFLGLFSMSVYSSQNISKPLPLCTNIESLTAYKMTRVFVNECSKHGVHLNASRAKAWLTDTLASDDRWTVSGCIAECTVSEALSNTHVTSCVEGRSDAFLEGALGNAHFNLATCNDFKSRF